MTGLRWIALVRFLQDVGSRVSPRIMHVICETDRNQASSTVYKPSSKAKKGGREGMRASIPEIEEGGQGGDESKHTRD